MALTWTPQEQVPAAAITLATGIGVQPIILSTHQYQVTEEDGSVYRNPWVIKSLDVSTQRDWSISTAKIIIVCELPQGTGFQKIPKLPNVHKYRGGINPYLTKEDEIRIYAGYLESQDEPITKELLTDMPIGLGGDDSSDAFQSFTKAIKDLKEQETDSKRKLAPIFWGFIDKMEIDASERGIQVLISCRDRMRIFSDTRVLNLNDPQGAQLGTLTTADTGNIESLTGHRDQIIFAIGRAAIGKTLNEGCSRQTESNNTTKSICWRDINKGYIAKGWESVVTKGNFGNKIEYKGKAPFLVIGNTSDGPFIEDPGLFIRAATLLPQAADKNPRFHIWTQRPPLTKNERKATLSIINKTPLEIINHLAITEERPIDFFASHVNGDFVFGPRAIDMSGFSDPNRFYRTYFFQSTPEEGKLPGYNQNIISMRGVTTTVGTYNRFVVLDGGANGGQTALLNSAKISIDILPYELQNRTVDPPCRTQLVFDGSLSSYSDMLMGGTLVGINAARRWARDINGIQITIPGDPTWYPGEAYRVYNTLIHDYDTITPAYGKSKELNASQEITREEAEARSQEIEEASKESKAKGLVCNNEPASELAAKFFNPNENEGITLTNVDNKVLPIYKARAINHSMIAVGAQKGFTTTIQGTADY